MLFFSQNTQNIVASENNKDVKYINDKVKKKFIRKI
jgi:hypothetical protein